MNEILALSLQAMQQGMTQLDRVAMNLAHVRTTGYKRDVGHVPFATHLQAAHPDRATGLTEANAAAATSRPATNASVVDPRPGALQATGQKLDVALAGPGWFEVSTPQGPAYTRNGTFQLDAQGRLVTARGQHPVMGLDGEIRLAHGAPVIDAQGRVFEGALPGGAPQRTDGTPLAQLKIVDFEPKAPLHRSADGLFTTEAQALALPDGQADLRQSYLEGSNVSTLHEMLQLMRTLRHFESMQKVATGYDELLGTAIRRLGEPV